MLDGGPTQALDALDHLENWRKEQNKTHNHFKGESTWHFNIETSLGRRHKEKFGNIFQDVIMDPCMNIVACKMLHWMGNLMQFVQA